jgi:hypothetical protein
VNVEHRARRLVLYWHYYQMLRKTALIFIWKSSQKLPEVPLLTEQVLKRRQHFFCWALSYVFINHLKSIFHAKCEPKK